MILFVFALVPIPPAILFRTIELSLVSKAATSDSQLVVDVEFYGVLAD